MERTIELVDVYPFHGIGVREGYEKMRFYTELMQEMGATQDEIDKGLAEWKRRLRKKIKLTSEVNFSRRLVAYDDYGYYTLLVRLGEFNSLADADDYFMWNEYMEYRESQYDCTGQHFTRRYYIFKRNGEYWAYHFISVDI